MIVRFEGYVTGRVQGVGFRWSMLQEAERLGVAGWCRNRSGDCVEFAVEGRKPAVAGMLEWLNHGPRWARVDAVVSRPATPISEQAFVVR